MSKSGDVLESLFENRPQCDHPDCPWCARMFFAWLKARMGQMNMVHTKKGDTTSFSEAAATSIRPPR